MGLDMYAYSVPKNEPIRVPSTDPDYEYEMHPDADPDYEYKMHPDADEFWYWRKNNALHGWMSNLAQESLGLSPGEFNCEYLQLSEAELNQLGNDIRDGKLKPTEGFFFGAPSYSEEDQKQDLEFVAQALRLIKEGKDIYYYSWW